ncbi:WYL domain-containing protein [Arthrobacter yangruifuii]|uniref:WYL domain-containing protein n=1 Tax=Arthrobacter yangruifuii TaxID=2606616 RepID=A0A5N6ME17_9MICC|nr:YafY family protein [Arthrobacter yangruifuii]KAD3436376.1 WYL domain-containing protein [Arthrobacter yangruifuii]
MLETSARLLQLLSLLQLRREWTGAALAERLSITERTVRRDIGKLRTLGYPISASPGIAGGYQLGAGAQLPPLLLDDDEALAVALGLTAVAAGPVTGIGEASVRALAKLEQVLPGRLRPQFSALSQSVSTLSGPPGGVDPKILTSFSSAITEHRILSFRYTAADGASQRRMVEPYRLVSTGRRWYAVAWDLDRSDWRTFRVDRCTSTPAPRARFTPRPLPAPDLAAYVQESITRNPYRYTVVVRLAAPLAAVAGQVPATMATVEADGPGHTIVRGGWDSLDLPLIHLTAWGVPFEILDPPEMRERARRALDLLQHAVEIPPTAESGKSIRPSH